MCVSAVHLHSRISWCLNIYTSNEANRGMNEDRGLSCVHAPQRCRWQESPRCCNRSGWMVQLGVPSASPVGGKQISSSRHFDTHTHTHARARARARTPTHTPTHIDLMKDELIHHSCAEHGHTLSIIEMQYPLISCAYLKVVGFLAPIRRRLGRKALAFVEPT
jgi:hypothetical protein